MAARRDAADRVKWNGAFVDRDIEPFLAVIAAVLRDQEHRQGAFQPGVERQSQWCRLGLCECDTEERDTDECDTDKQGRRNHCGGATTPKEIGQGAQASSVRPLTLWSSPRSA